MRSVVIACWLTLFIAVGAGAYVVGAIVFRDVLGWNASVGAVVAFLLAIGLMRFGLRKLRRRYPSIGELPAVITGRDEDNARLALAALRSLAASTPPERIVFGDTAHAATARILVRAAGLLLIGLLAYPAILTLAKLVAPEATADYLRSTNGLVEVLAAITPQGPGGRVFNSASEWQAFRQHVAASSWLFGIGATIAALAGFALARNAPLMRITRRLLPRNGDLAAVLGLAFLAAGVVCHLTLSVLDASIHSGVGASLSLLALAEVSMLLVFSGALVVLSAALVNGSD